MVSTPARDPARSSMDPASASKECPKPCSRLHSEFLLGRLKNIFKVRPLSASTAAGPLRDFYEA